MARLNIDGIRTTLNLLAVYSINAAVLFGLSLNAEQISAVNAMLATLISLFYYLVKPNGQAKPEAPNRN